MRCQQVWMWRRRGGCGAGGDGVAPAGTVWRRRGGCGGGGVGVAPAGTNGCASGGGCGECDAGISGVLWSMVRCAASIVHGGPSSGSGTAPVAGFPCSAGSASARCGTPRGRPGAEAGMAGHMVARHSGAGTRSPSEVTYATIKLFAAQRHSDTYDSGAGRDGRSPAGSGSCSRQEF
jgi:hypothetical protein